MESFYKTRKELTENSEYNLKYKKYIDKKKKRCIIAV